MEFQNWVFRGESVCVFVFPESPDTISCTIWISLHAVLC